MKCPECEKSGDESTLAEGESSETTMGFLVAPYSDAGGRLHSHDPNTVTTPYECSNGHRFTASGKRPCWCGWPDEAPKIRSISPAPIEVAALPGWTVSESPDKRLKIDD